MTCRWQCDTPHEGGGFGMNHPRTRAERRHQRQRIINYRKFIRVNGCSYPWPDQIWSQYAKWNGGCGCMLCHSDKYFGHKRKRRNALKKIEVE